MRHALRQAIWLGSLRQRRVPTPPPAPPSDPRKEEIAAMWENCRVTHAKTMAAWRAVLEGPIYAAPGFTPTERDTWAVVRTAP